MYNDVTLELRNKIRRELDILEDYITENGNSIARLKFTKEDIHLIEECKEWLNVIKRIFRCSYDAYRLENVGRFKGVKPIDVTDDDVLFSVVSHSEPSWKDWFDLTGENDGFLKGTVGNVINERTHPEYYKDGKYIWEKEK